MSRVRACAHSDDNYSRIVVIVAPWGMMYAMMTRQSTRLFLGGSPLEGVLLSLASA